MQMNQPQVVSQQPTFTNVTTVVIQQPGGKKAWSSNLSDCCADIKVCFCVLCCQNWYFGCMASRMGENCCVGLSGCHLAMRARFRGTHDIGGGICDDFCILSNCHMCAMCQLAREMDHLGYPNNGC